MCWKCGKAIALEGPIGRSTVCDSCGADVRSCRNCRFYSPGSWHDCAERVEDSPREKDRANFCDSFALNPRYRVDHVATGTVSGKGGSSSAKKAFDDLFGA
jgi:hypothetical protein